MRPKFDLYLTAAALVFVSTLFLPSCEAEHKGPPPSTSQAVYVIFEGPWAIVPDPKDPNSVIAIAPKTKHHRPLAFVPGERTLEAGIYDLSVPAHGPVDGRNLDSGFLRASVDPKNVALALGNKMERYAVRLPKPESYLAEVRFESRVSADYPPKEDKQQNYVSAISLVYHVTTLTGFQLAGTLDEGPSYKPYLPTLETPALRFVLDPLEYPDDDCDTHPRQAFHDLTKLLGVKLFVDFPRTATPVCHGKDPQQPDYKKAEVSHEAPGQLIAGLRGSQFVRPQEAAFIDDSFARYAILAADEAAHRLAAILYFFHTSICKSPTILGDGA